MFDLLNRVSKKEMLPERIILMVVFTRTFLGFCVYSQITNTKTHSKFFWGGANRTRGLFALPVRLIAGIPLNIRIVKGLYHFP